MKFLSQSTYWGRFPIAINPDLDEQTIFPKEFFIDKNICEGNIDRFSIVLSQIKNIWKLILKIWAHDYDDFPYMKDTKVWEKSPTSQESRMCICKCGITVIHI